MIQHYPYFTVSGHDAACRVKLEHSCRCGVNKGTTGMVCTFGPICICCVCWRDAGPKTRGDEDGTEGRIEKGQAKPSKQIIKRLMNGKWNFTIHLIEDQGENIVLSKEQNISIVGVFSTQNTRCLPVNWTW